MVALRTRSGSDYNGNGSSNGRIYEVIYSAYGSPSLKHVHVDVIRLVTLGCMKSKHRLIWCSMCLLKEDDHLVEHIESCEEASGYYDAGNEDNAMDNKFGRLDKKVNVSYLIFACVLKYIL
eukprot:1132224_1